VALFAPHQPPEHGASPLTELGALKNRDVLFALAIGAIGFGGLFAVYTYLANTFSEVQGITIEKFFIAHKIERVKELLVYNELSLTEIAYQMHYSSVAHLSAQFKKVTGLTPSHFKRMKDQRRSMLEDV